MNDRPHIHLSRRERQIMDVLYQQQEASAQTVKDALPNSPSYSAVRALLKKLLDKGHVVFREEGSKYIYRPVLAKSEASESAMERLVNTFFNGSAAAAVVGLLGRREGKLSGEDVAAIQSALKALQRQEESRD